MSWSRTLFAFAFAASLATVAHPQQTLEKGFQNPPDSAKPHTWWHWINGNISKQGITADLEAMKRIGIGGAQIFNVDVGIPAGKTPFMSPKWNEAIAHAIKEARRLGIEICVHNCAGWSSSGGPWIKPEYAMQFLTWSETPVHGPTHFDDSLKQPPTREKFYRDIAVYAIRKPDNDKFRIPNIRAKAGFDRGDRILPEIKPSPDGTAIARSDVRMIGSGDHVSWDVPEGDWIIIRMGYTPTGEGNHPAPAEGYGLEVDKLSRKALDTHWAGMVASVLKDAGAVGTPGFNNVLVDSYEVGSQNWSPEFRADFRKRRGYDPLPYLPVVTGRVVGSLEVSERFLWDLRRTICDLFADNYYAYFAQLCHQHGLKFSDEGYGNGSFDNLQCCGLADIPMGEFWIGGLAIETTKLAASAGHIYGKPVIGAESFTADTARGKWLTDPYAIKALGDQAFSLGINRYIFHRYAMQPWIDVVPGMTMGPWGTHFDRTETWWNQGAAWIKYVSRCEYLLQSGRFAADIVAFTGEEGPNDLPMLQEKPVPRGYDYDGCDTVTLMKMRVENAQIVLPSGMRYRVMLLPESTWMTPRVASKIASLVRDGAVVLGPKPTRSPSLSDMGANDGLVAQTGNTVWGNDDGKSVKRHRYGKGWVYWNEKLTAVLADIKCGQDFDLVQGWDLNWIHRIIDGADVYFVANPKYIPGRFDVSFRVSGEEPEIWDAETGSRRVAEVWQSKGGRTIVPLRLESAGSVFVVFRHRAQAQHLVSIIRDGPGAAKEKLPKIEIISARYDADDGTGGVDVTEKARQIVAHGVTEIAANNGNFGDPAVNHRKHLKLAYTINGRRFERSVEENEVLEFVGRGSDSTRPDFTVAEGKLYMWSPGTYSLQSAGGRAVKVKTAQPASIVAKGPWALSFPPNLGAPSGVMFVGLGSWTDSANPGVRYFSGSATYRSSIDVPASALRAGVTPFLDLGKVKNIAEVWINGKLQPTLWKAPFRLAAAGLKPGRNELVIRVTNLWPNRLIGDEQLPAENTWKDDGSIKTMPDWALDMKPRPKSDRITFATWNFFPKDSALLESGLIGPVSIVVVPTVRLGR